MRYGGDMEAVKVGELEIGGEEGETPRAAEKGRTGQS